MPGLIGVVCKECSDAGPRGKGGRGAAVHLAGLVHANLHIDMIPSFGLRDG